jgi:LDH2 family malate/lactate/ureidoglycolate dehydrogenase
VREIFVAEGATDDNAATVAAHLVEATAMGIESHGLMRVAQYVEEIRAGALDPGAEPLATSRGPAKTVVDGRFGFGQVAGVRAAEIAAEIARAQGTACVHVTSTGHTGRIGAYAEALARAGLIGLAVSAGPRSGHRVAPFGGLEGRLATNPIAYAYPCGTEIVSADFATSATTEGHVRNCAASGSEAPPNALRDAEGEWTRDPAALYADRPGTIQPLGGESGGHKGFALGLLVEVLASLAIDEQPADPSRQGSTMTLIALTAGPGLAAVAAEHAGYVRSARPEDPERPVQLPGDREREALARPFVVADGVRQALSALAEHHGISSTGS